MQRNERSTRIYLSVPHMSGEEKSFIDHAFASNWLSTVGPNLDLFEQEFSHYIGLPCVALSSGTAAIHLGLRLLGVGPGDTVLCATLTFAASANPVRYLGAEPIFVDSDRSTWNMDPNLLDDALRSASRAGKLPKAVVAVDLYGQCADYDSIFQSCSRYGVPILEDAAEALGASYRHNLAGTLGQVGVFSLNGNKVITTSGGGLLVSSNKAWVEKARFWSQQAREPGLAYTHAEIGHNYRLSNVLAGIGCGQLKVLDVRVKQRRAIASRYIAALADLPGIEPMPEAPFGRASRWLTCFVIDPARFGASRDGVIAALAKENIESRPVWKPMHLQPLYQGCKSYGGQVARSLFDHGICLPSSSNLPEEDQLSVINAIRRTAGAPDHPTMPIAGSESPTGKI
jgi:pyridoxal phosphate-dependent aminotransferase EpsN